jgi:hypothetical protein
MFWIKKNPTIIEFYCNQRAYSKDIFLKDILKKDDIWLETSTNYFPWIFPLDKPSLKVKSSPILMQEDIRFFKENEECQNNMRFVLQRMLNFWGIAYEKHDMYVLGNSPLFIASQPHNHNYRRLSRAMRSLKLLGFQEEAEQLQACCLCFAKEYPQCVSEKTVWYWKIALII